jgi:hypothetical protein
MYPPSTSALCELVQQQQVIAFRFRYDLVRFSTILPIPLSFSTLLLVRSASSHPYD